MLCEECGEREAAVVVTTVINGESTSRNLCRECVKKYQKGGDVSALLAAILSSMYKARGSSGKKCSHCGMTLEEFNKTGMLGCAECYRTFRSELDPMLNRIQGRTQHAGRRPHADPAALERSDRIMKLRRAMEAAVSEEAFEEAARLRDELKKLQEGGKEEPAKEGAGE
ncbi:MAG: UvrB/UvrC motif-containing protein [Clostridia bacterium]|nr:UvrB/UvrC motif-containing protein [Clostridia bacterium]